MDLVQLETREQARAVAALARATGGAPALEDPDALWALNQGGRLRSLVALDGRDALAHIGLASPFADLEDDGEPVFSGEVLELVHGLRRIGAGPAGARALDAARVLAAREGAAGLLVRRSAESPGDRARALGMRPLGLLLGARAGDGARRSSWLDWMDLQPEGPRAARALHRPAGLGWTDVCAAGIDRLRLDGAPGPADGPTVLRARWTAETGAARVAVLQLGGDLIPRLEQALAWLLGAGAAHVTVLLPGDAPALGALGPALAGLGLFGAGWVPGLLAGGRDAVLMQALARGAVADPRAEDPVEQHILDGVRAGQAATQGASALGRGRRGGVRARVLSVSAIDRAP
jgi:hypothetical protein